MKDSPNVSIAGTGEMTSLAIAFNSFVGKIHRIVSEIADTMGHFSSVVSQTAEIADETNQGRGATADRDGSGGCRSEPVVLFCPGGCRERRQSGLNPPSRQNRRHQMAERLSPDRSQPLNLSRNAIESVSLIQKLPPTVRMSARLSR